MTGTMPRRLPQLNALKAFEAAARHVSFTHAAAELCVTQGAVSHQVKALESELGVKLSIASGSGSSSPKPAAIIWPPCATHLIASPWRPSASRSAKVPGC